MLRLSCSAVSFQVMVYDCVLAGARSGYEDS